MRFSITRLVAFVNTELQNNDQGVLEFFALDAGYVIKQTSGVFSREVTNHAEEAELQQDLGMLFENIEDRENIEEYQQLQAAGFATSA